MAEVAAASIQTVRYMETTVRKFHDKILLGYSAVLATVLTGVAVNEAISGPAKVVFEEIDVQRINVRERDGTVRMVIHNSGRQPGGVYKGAELAHPGRQAHPEAGILFYNDEGTENGGLTFSGRRGPDGRLINSSGGLSFDQFEQDQVVVLSHSETPDGRRRAGLNIADRPDKPMPFEEMARRAGATPAEQKAMTERWIADGRMGGTNRLFVGKTNDRSSVVTLSDVKGRPRIALLVKPDGAASIQFLDEDGKVVRALTPDEGKGGS